MSVADWIAAAAALVGLITLLLGYGTYRDNVRTTRLKHMHSLFGDYLDHEFNLQLQPDNIRTGNAKHSLNAFKAYTLEEMWLWLQHEETDRPWWGKKRRDHDQLMAGWTNTISYHIARSSPEDLAAFALYRHCYSSRFAYYMLDHPTARAALAPKPQEAEAAYRARLLALFEDSGVASNADPGATAELLAAFFRRKPTTEVSESEGDAEILALAGAKGRIAVSWQPRQRPAG